MASEIRTKVSGIQNMSPRTSGNQVQFSDNCPKMKGVQFSDHFSNKLWITQQLLVLSSIKILLVASRIRN